VGYFVSGGKLIYYSTASSDGALYTGLMGILVAVNAPAVSPFWEATVLALSATA
jgi:hypothetical protein